MCAFLELLASVAYSCSLTHTVPQALGRAGDRAASSNVHCSPGCRGRTLDRNFGPLGLGNAHNLPYTCRTPAVPYTCCHAAGPDGPGPPEQHVGAALRYGASGGPHLHARLQPALPAPGVRGREGARDTYKRLRAPVIGQR